MKLLIEREKWFRRQEHHTTQSNLWMKNRMLERSQRALQELSLSSRRELLLIKRLDVGERWDISMLRSNLRYTITHLQCMILDSKDLTEREVTQEIEPLPSRNLDHLIIMVILHSTMSHSSTKISISNSSSSLRITTTLQEHSPVWHRPNLHLIPTTNNPTNSSRTVKDTTVKHLLHRTPVYQI